MADTKEVVEDTTKANSISNSSHIINSNTRHIHKDQRPITTNISILISIILNIKIPINPTKNTNYPKQPKTRLQRTCLIG